MMYTIAKRFTFDAAHQIDGLAPGHKCSRLHGHTYSVELILQSETLVAPGFVMDYGELAPFKAWVDANLDHRNLNDVTDFRTTAENLARWLFEVVTERWSDWPLVAVRVSETPATWAEWRP